MFGDPTRTMRRLGDEAASPLARGALALALWASLPSCAARPLDVVPIEVRIGSNDPRCRPTTVRAVRLAAEGDFVPGPTDTVELLTASGSRDVAGLSPSLLALRAELDGDSGYRAIGQSSLDAARRFGVLAVLPPRIPCALVDPDAFLPPHATLVAHPDGSAWVIGGRGAGRRIVRIDPRRSFSEVFPDALFNRREGASATVWGEDVYVAGGASADTDGAHDSYERLGPSGHLVEAAIGGRLALARRDHAAIATRGRLVLVGGRTGGTPDALVAPIEILTPSDGASRLGPALLVPRAMPVVTRLADGSLVVAGGRDEGGAPVTLLERIDPSLARVEPLDVTLPPAALVLPLALDQLLVVAARELFVVDLRSEPPRVERLARRSAITAPEGLVTRAGRVLLTGPSASGAIVAELWTPHTGALTRLEAPRAPAASAWIDAGAVVALDSGGAWLRALEEPGLWSSLPNDRLFVTTERDSPFLVGSLPSDLVDARATSAGARLGLGALRLASASIRLDAAGSYTLVLRPDDGDERVEVRFGADGSARGAGCSLEPVDAPITLSRERERVELVGASGRRSRCEDVAPSALLSLEVELDVGTSPRVLEVARRGS